MKFGLENQEEVPIIETVRTALFHNGKFLILQKDETSRNAGNFEFPGGKIDEIKGKDSTLEEQKLAVTTEIEQETGIDVHNLPVEKIEDFGLFYEATEKDGKKKKYKRKVHLFLIRIPDKETPTLRINETKDAEGESEDRHEKYMWVSPDELVERATVLKENPHTKEKVYPLTPHSRHIKKLLTAVGYLQ